jgi:hypothetical protein
MEFKGRNVLNVIPCQWMEPYLPKQTPGITMHNLFDDNYPHLRSLNYDWEGCFRMALNYAREHNIDVTIASHDRASMIQAAVNDALGLPGISLAAQFYCNNKYYGRTIEDDPIWYSYLDPDESDEANLARVTRYPVIVKPVYSTASVWHRVAHTPMEIVQALHYFRVAGLVEECKRFNRFYATHLKAADLPEPVEALKYIIVEELMDSNLIKISYDGWIDAQGKQYPWCVSDEKYFPDTMLLNCYKCPSDLSVGVKERVRVFVENHMAKLVAKGYLNNIHNIQLWLTPDRRMFVTEVNPRMVAANSWVYENAYGMENYFYINARYALGERPNATPWVLEKAGGSKVLISGEFYLTVNRPGKVSELIDVEYLRDFIERNGPGNVRMIKEVSDQVAEHDIHATGCCLLSFYLKGGSYEEVAREADRIRDGLIG